MKTLPLGLGREKLFLSVLSGVFLTAGFPLTGISLASWFALSFLLVALRDTPPRQSFFLGLAAGSVHYMTLLYWLVSTINIYGYLPLWLSVVIFIPLAFYLSLYIGVFAWLVSFAGGSPGIALVLVPCGWVCLEYLRSFMFTGFPWGLIGYTQANSLPIIQIADLFGVYGVSFILVFASGVIGFAWMHARGLAWKGRMVGRLTAAVYVSLLTGVMIVVWSYGMIRIGSMDKMIAESGTVNVGVIQGNIDQSEKWDRAFRESIISTYIRLSEQAARSKSLDLVIWPETSAPFYFNYDETLTEMVLQGIGNMGPDFIIGSPTVEFSGPDDFYYNSAYLISPNGEVAGRVDKVHLVPFGEYVPFRKWLPFISPMVEQVGEFKTGRIGDTLAWPPADIGVLICYEIIFPELAAHMVENGAGLLVNITNDAWFGNTGAPWQHFDMAVFRAVENRRAVIRAANTGVSGWIDPAGRVAAASGLFVEAALTGTVPVVKNFKTFYTRHGDLLVLCCFIAILGIVMVSIVESKKRTGGWFHPEGLYNK
ncbi:MAG: apolipoprotein N-acyltransferase [Desulfobacteraceae bacterium]|nr:MAG: apolipoprotein N-acyltransferase [Desulfobacteraceae bacterium]